MAIRNFGLSRPVSADGEVAGLGLSQPLGIVGGILLPALQALILSASSATVGTAFTGSIVGATPGSTIAVSGAGSAGLSVTGSGVSRTLSGTPTAAGAVILVETLPGATGSPRTTSGLLTVSVASGADPNRYMFAATRLRFPNATGTLSGSGTVYCVQSFFIGTPDYAVSNPRFFLPTFYGVTTGANPSEFALPTPYQYEKLALKVGGTWYECPNAAFTVDPAVDASGFLLDAIPVTMPANSVIECRYAWNAPGGSTLAGVSRGNDIAEISMLSTSGSLAAKCTDGSALTANGFSRHVIPAFMVAKGWDGRPVGLLAGDSIQAGANENSITGFMSPRGTQGYWQRGLDDNANSQRIAFGTLALEGARPSDWSTRANWSRKLDAVAKVTALNSNKPPMTFIGSNHGNNSASIANPYSWLTGFWQVLKTEWPGVPIYHSELLARPVSSSDGWQSLAGQIVQASDAYNGGTSPGIRWTANDLIGKGAQFGDPAAQARADGWIQGSFAAWRPGSYDTGANRDKLAIVAFDTTITADSAANNLSITLASVTGIALGEMLVVNPGGTGSYDAIVKAINGNVVTLSGGSSTAMATGTRVTAALNDRTGLHPGTRHHIKIANEAVVPWKQFMGWVNAVVDPAPLSLANLPSAIRSILPGSDTYEGGAYLGERRKVGRTSANALKDAATATLPTGWTRDTTNKWLTLTSSVPSDQTTISDWLLQDDWTFRIPASGGSTLNFTFSNNVIKPSKTKICAIDNRQNGNFTIINNDIGGSIQDAAQCQQTFVMHPGGTGTHTYKDNAFWNMPEDHIRLSEGGGTVQGNFFFGGGQSQLEDPHFDCIQVLPNVVPRTLKGNIVVKDNYFDMRRGIGHVQAVRLADIAAIDSGVTITITGNVFVDPNYDISFPGQNTPIVITGNYFAAQPFPSYQKSGAADYGEYLAPIPSQAVIYDNYRLETGAKLTVEQNRPT